MVRQLNIGDQLYAESSWNVLVVTIVSVSETEAIANNGNIYARKFRNGSRKINQNGAHSLDFDEWYIDEQANKKIH